MHFIKLPLTSNQHYMQRSIQEGSTNLLITCSSCRIWFCSFIPSCWISDCWDLYDVTACFLSDTLQINSEVFHYITKSLTTTCANTCIAALIHHIASSVQCSIITYKRFIKENLQPLYTKSFHNNADDVTNGMNTGLHYNESVNFHCHVQWLLLHDIQSYRKSNKCTRISWEEMKKSLTCQNYRVLSLLSSSFFISSLLFSFAIATWILQSAQHITVISDTAKCWAFLFTPQNTGMGICML